MSKKKKQESSGPVFVQKVIKDDTYLVMSASQYFPEDEFVGLYYSQTDSSKVFLQPPYEPKRLQQLAFQNNILNQCVEAMEVNIDGTGHELVPIEDAKKSGGGKAPVAAEGDEDLAEDEPEEVEETEEVPEKELVKKWGGFGGGGFQKKPPAPKPSAAKPKPEDDAEYQLELERINGFLDEPYPNKSLTTIRREMRRDVETIGWGALEVLRSLDEVMVGLRNIATNTLRYVRFDQPVQVTKSVTRNGVEVKLTFWDRERRFAQKIGPTHYVYFREFGTSRHIHRDTGEWETETKKVPPELRGTELIVFRVHPDIDTPYGVPRWINQMPSVVGSRKAEEQNLEFFDAGGLPPAIIFIQGGTLAKDMADSLRQYLSGQLKSRHRAVVVEAMPSSGSIESAGKVEVKVERFGAEGQKDAMYQAYDTRSEEHVRVAFRLPPIFIGRSQDYNFATAQTGYMVAEAQVFQPERMKFDEVFNGTVMKALGAKKCKFKSKPITLKDGQLAISALGTVSSLVEPEGMVQEVNTLTGMSLTFKEPPPPVLGVGPDGMPIEGQPGQEAPATPFGSQAGIDGHVEVEKIKAEAEVEKAKAGGGNVIPFGKKQAVEKADYGTAQKTLALAKAFCEAEGLVSTKFDYSNSSRQKIRKSVDALPAAQRELLNKFVAIQVKASLDSGEVPPCCAE